MEKKLAVDELLGGYLKIANRPLSLCSKDKILWSNESLGKLVARAATDLSDSDVTELLAAPLVLSQSRSMVSANYLLHATGVEVQCEIRSIPLGGDVWALEVTVKSFYDQEGELAVYKQRLWTLADQVPVGIFISEVGMRVQYVNDRLTEIFEATSDELIGLGWTKFFPQAQWQEIEAIALEVLQGTRGDITVDIVTANDRTKRLHMQFSDVQSSDRAAGFVGTVEDVTDRVAHEQRLTYAATHDTLTQLPNRAALEVDLHTAVHDVQDGQLEGLMLAFCDLDDFKAVNDSYGHLVGDQLLIETASRLRHACRVNDRAYRYAGDEFVLIFPDVVSEYDAMEIMARLEQAMEPKIELDDLEFAVSVSFGYSIGMGANVSMETLLDSADEAMYAMKTSKRLLSVDLYGSSGLGSASGVGR